MLSRFSLGSVLVAFFVVVAALERLDVTLTNVDAETLSRALIDDMFLRRTDRR